MQPVNQDKPESVKSRKTTHLTLLFSPVAQPVEQVAVNHFVGGSSPSRGANSERSRVSKGTRLLFLLPLHLTILVWIPLELAQLLIFSQQVSRLSRREVALGI